MRRANQKWLERRSRGGRLGEWEAREGGRQQRGRKGMREIRKNDEIFTVYIKQNITKEDRYATVKK